MLVALRAKSQITLPKPLVDKLGVSVGDSFDIYENEGVICLAPVTNAKKSSWPKELVEYRNLIDNETFLEETEEERIARQLKALDEFREGLSASEPLRAEFDEIISRRVNMTRDIDL